MREDDARGFESWTVFDPKREEPQTLPNVEDLSLLPLWGAVGLGLRSTRRVRWMFRDKYAERGQFAVFEKALSVAEKSAGSGRQKKSVRELESLASKAYHELQTSDSARNVSGAKVKFTICVDHAAAAVVNTLISVAAADRGSRSMAVEAATHAIRAVCHAAQWRDYQDSVLLSDRHQVAMINEIASDFAWVRAVARAESWGDSSREPVRLLLRSATQRSHPWWSGLTDYLRRP